MDVELFRNRTEAGRMLASRLLDYKDKRAVVLAIPRGGIPVGFEVAKKLSAEFDVVIPRKIPIPWNPEAGFGATMPDGTRVLNHAMVKNLGLKEEEIDRLVDEVREETLRRTRMYRGEKPPPSVTDRPVLLVDDGLASGYTMLAAIEWLKSQKPSSIAVAVPVASSGSARLVAPRVDKLIALIISQRLPFAVANFYLEWRDLTDDEVLDCLHQSSEVA